jgi:predicted nucleotidyltransferase
MRRDQASGQRPGRPFAPAVELTLMASSGRSLLSYDSRKLARVARELGLRLVVLHGSRAERRQERDSDIDLAVLAAGEIGTDRRLDIYQRLGEIITGAPLDLSFLNGAQPTFLEIVAETGVPLFQAEETDFVRFQALAMSMFADAGKWQEAQREHLDQPREEPE